MIAPQTLPRNAGLRMALAVLLALLFWCVGTGRAWAGASVGTVTINGETSVNVVPGSPLAITVTASLTGSTDWQSTRFTFGTYSVCSDLPNITSSGTYNRAFTINAPPGNGTYTMSVTIYEQDGCVTQAATRASAGTVVTDNTAPRVLSITRDSPNPTNVSPVVWILKFDRQVDGVTLDDFDFAASGVTGLSLTGTYFTADTSTYTMETTHTGNGTLGLNIVDNDTIVGPNGLPLGGVGAGNGNFVGQVYEIDRAGPTYPTVGITSTNIYNNQFARTGDTVTVAFTTDDASVMARPTATINGVTATVTGSGTSWSASRVLTASDADGPVVFRIQARDALNYLSFTTSVTNGSSVVIDRTAPTLGISCASPAACGTANPTAATQVSWNVTFSEPVSGVAPGNFTLKGTGAAGTSIASVTGGPVVWTVTANLNGTGVIGLNFEVNVTNVRDRAGNTPGTVLATAGNSYTKGGCSVAAGGGCTFDAVEPGAGPVTPIFMKRFGTSFKLDILARNGAILNTGSTDKVVVTLVVASNDAACGSIEVADPVSVDFAPANGGRLNLTLLPKRAARDVRVKMVSSGVTACSSDNFAVRPDSFTISSSAATADASGINVSATPVLKAASTVFALQAAAALGYDGVPVLNLKRLQASSGVLGNLAGNFGAANPTNGAATGSPASTAFTYSEVGYFRMLDWAVYDNTFANVDRVKTIPDCVEAPSLTGTGVPPDPNTADAAGKFGCHFGSAQSNYFGRFIPAHFALSGASIVNRSPIAACAAAPFTYMGETLVPTFKLTAQNGLNATTVNYTGTYAKLEVASQLGLGAIDDPGAPGVRRPVGLCAATPVAPCYTATTPSGSFTNGVSSTITAPLAMARGSSAVAPLSAFKVGVAPTDIDQVRLASYNLDTVAVLPGTPQRALVGSTIVRYGRLQIDNAYGSELLNLTMKVTAQYWNGTSYAINALDSCTPLDSGLTIGGHKGGITSANMKQANVVVGTAMTNGSGRVVLTRPLPAPLVKGSAALTSGNASLPGTGRATFGVYKAGPVIYVRETY